MPKILLEIPNELLIRIDSKAKSNHLKRSEAARIALSFWLKEGENLVPPIKRPGISAIIREMDDFRRRGHSRKGAERLVREGRERD
jgi:hypothetical protein